MFETQVVTLIFSRETLNNSFVRPSVKKLQNTLFSISTNLLKLVAISKQSLSKFLTRISGIAVIQYLPRQERTVQIQDLRVEGKVKYTLARSKAKLSGQCSLHKENMGWQLGV